MACCALEHPPPKHDVKSLREAEGVRRDVLSTGLADASALLCELERERAEVRAALERQVPAVCELSESIRARARELVECIEARCAVSLRELSDSAASVQSVLEDRESALSLQCAEVCRLRDELESMRLEGSATVVDVSVGAVEDVSVESSSVGSAYVSDGPWLVH